MNTVGSCPHCRRQVQIPEQMRGKWVTCPLCGQAFIAAGAESVERIEYGGYVKPHRGAVVLTLGILAVLFYIIGWLLGPIAWVMGSRDLSEMKRGTMDKSGYGITQAGYVLGIVGTILGVLIGLFFVVMILVGVMLED